MKIYNIKPRVYQDIVFHVDSLIKFYHTDTICETNMCTQIIKENSLTVKFEKIYITYWNDNIIQMRSMCNILLTFMGDIYFLLYKFNGPCVILLSTFCINNKYIFIYLLFTSLSGPW